MVAGTKFCPFTAGSKPWIAKLAGNQELLCSKIREEAGELCETLERQEGQERATSEMADLLYLVYGASQCPCTSTMSSKTLPWCCQRNAYFDSEIPFLSWKSKLRSVWGQ